MKNIPPDGTFLHGADIFFLFQSEYDTCIIVVNENIFMLQSYICISGSYYYYFFFFSGLPDYTSKLTIPDILS